MPTATLARIQVCFLIAASMLLLWAAPEAWNYTPDGGIYVGTASALAETGAYRFNGHPNLLYYPGLSGLLSLTILVFGLKFQVMHLVCAGVAVACLWLARAYFSWGRYGVVGIAVPVALLAAGDFQRQVFNILSDGLFLALVLSAALLWRKFAEASSDKALLGCCVMVAAAPLVRFEGLLLCMALGAALLHRAHREKRLDLRGLLRLAAIGFAITAPFALWTWRNWILYTPDTFNVANQFLFGLDGLRLYAQEPDPSVAPGPLWQYAVVRVVLFVTSLAETILGRQGVDLLPREFWFVAIVGLCATGSVRWFKAASVFERAFVLLSLAFLLLWTLKGGRSLYVVPRYWLPVLPFVLAMAGFGIAVLRARAKAAPLGAPLRHAIGATAAVLMAVAMVSGGARFAGFLGQDAYYRNAGDVIRMIDGYVSEHVPLETPIATTDWGVMPFSLKRRSYQVLDDASHRLTLRRMQDYRTRYLVILDGLAVFPPVARHMVGQFPEIFAPRYEARPAGPGPVASVYAVDLTALKSTLDTLAKEGREPRREARSLGSGLTTKK